MVLKHIFLKIYICYYLRTKFQIYSLISTNFRHGVVLLLPLSLLQMKLLKSPTKFWLRLRNTWLWWESTKLATQNTNVDSCTKKLLTISCKTFDIKSYVNNFVDVSTVFCLRLSKKNIFIFKSAYSSIEFNFLVF